MCLHYFVKPIARVQTTIPQLIANNMSGCFLLKHGVYSSWRLLVITNVSHNAVICIRSSTAKRLGVRSGAERTVQGNDFELIPTIKMETRHLVEIYFGREIPEICYHCGVLAA